MDPDTIAARQRAFGRNAGLDDVVAELEIMATTALAAGISPPINERMMRRFGQLFPNHPADDTFFAQGIALGYRLAKRYLAQHKGGAVTPGFTRAMRLKLYQDIEISVAECVDQAYPPQPDIQNVVSAV